MKKQIFIAGTDTNVGKTRVAGLLAQALAQTGVSVVTQKWVQTGCLVPEDVHQHDLFLGHSEPVQSGSSRSPYCFETPVSPHLAGHVDIAVLKAAFLDCVAQADWVLVEGAGGLMVPLNSKSLMVDLVAELGVGVILVAENRVGGINHTLLSIEALRHRHIPIQGIVWNQVHPTVSEQVLCDNPKIVSSYLQNWGLQVAMTQLAYEERDGKKVLTLLD